MRLLLVHPSSLMYSEIFLRLEPLGLERVAAARARGRPRGPARGPAGLLARRADRRRCASFRPEAVGFSLNYLANVPEAIDLATAAKQVAPGCFVFFGGHSVSFVAEDVLAQAEGASTRRPRARARPSSPRVLEAVRDGGAGHRARRRDV